MRCNHIAKQTRGEIDEVQIDGLICNRADICRRKGICVLSPFSRTEVVSTDDSAARNGNGNNHGSTEEYPTYYEVLKFKNALGYQWVRMHDFEEAVREAENRPDDQDYPRLIRRMDFHEVPEKD